MKTALESLVESLEAGTWRPNRGEPPWPNPVPSKRPGPSLIHARIEYAEPDPAGSAVRALLKPGEYLDERGVIRKIQ